MMFNLLFDPHFWLGFSILPGTIILTIWLYFFIKWWATLDKDWPWGYKSLEFPIRYQPLSVQFRGLFFKSFAIGFLSSHYDKPEK